VPLYEYRCKSCKHQFEVIQKFSDDPVRLCPECGLEAIEQLLCAPTVQFKGSGWYVTDYARKGSSAEGSAKGDGDSGNGDSKKGNGDSKGADSGSTPPVPESKPASSASAESK
jgi:putative FmdB family regulatory protein